LAGGVNGVLSSATQGQAKRCGLRLYELVALGLARALLPVKGLQHSIRNRSNQKIFKFSAEWELLYVRVKRQREFPGTDEQVAVKKGEITQRVVVIVTFKSCCVWTPPCQTYDYSLPKMVRNLQVPKCNDR